MPVIGFIAESLIFLLVVAVSFLVLTLLASFMRFYFLAQRVKLADPSEQDPEERFRLQVVQSLGALHQKPDPFTLLLVAVRRLADGSRGPEDESQEKVPMEIAYQLRSRLRDQDVVLPRSTAVFGVIGQFPWSCAERIVQRLLEDPPHWPEGTGLSRKCVVQIGGAAFPEHGDHAASLIAMADEALSKAQSAGLTPAWRFPASVSPSPLPPADTHTPTTPGPANPMVDPVTGALKAERLDAALRKMVAQQRKDARPVSVVYCSIDHYRHYLNHYPESVGLQVLKRVADVLGDETRESDILARTGEADFVLILDCTPAAAAKLGERLHERIRQPPLSVEGQTLKLAISTGVAGYPDHTGDARAMKDFARTAMWSARARGTHVPLLYDPAMVTHQPDDNEPKDTF